jgi:poly(3-hydroxybutyrate) depolymerase
LKEPLFGHPNPSRRPIHFLEFHGDSDPVIHYDGKTTPDGPTYNVREYLEGWAKLNGSKPEPSRQEKLFDGKVEKLSWDTEHTENVIQHYKFQGLVMVGQLLAHSTTMNNDMVRPTLMRHPSSSISSGDFDMRLIRVNQENEAKMTSNRSSSVFPRG